MWNRRWRWRREGRRIRRRKSGRDPRATRMSREGGRKTREE